jgi:hypothetical protein
VSYTDSVATRTKAPTDISSLLIVKEGDRNGWPVLKGSTITVHNLAATYSREEMRNQLLVLLNWADPID